MGRRLPHVLALALLASSGALATLVPAQRGGGDEQAPGDRARPAEGEPEADEAADPEEDLASTYFQVADYNGDGFVSFKEGSASLGADRESFAGYDLDRDGRINPLEFERRYAKTIELGGAFPPPIPQPKARRAPKRTAAELLEAYDANRDDKLDDREVGKALEEYAIHDVAPALALETVDKDRTGSVETTELESLLHLLDPTTQPAKNAAKSVLELFGTPTSRELREGMTLLPPQVVGPVPAFYRFDLDRDRAISLDDLVELQRPMQLAIRINAVLAALDLDRDGAISEREFRASMAGPGR